MLWFIYILAVLIFSLAFFALKIISTCASVVTLSLNAIETVANHQLPDHEKQKQIQALSLLSLKQFFSLLIKIFLLAVAVSSPFFLFDYLSVVDMNSSVAFASRIDILLATTVMALFAYYFLKKIFGNNKQSDNKASISDASSYSDSQRVIHNLAFGSAGLQKSMHGIESRLFSKTWQAADAHRPIFVCALPRAGTTALLEVLNSLPGLSSHLYRDMPFIFSPILWNALSSPFQKTQKKKERAHGDGLLVNEDSPEAFEELIWLKFFPQKYSQDRIHLWKKSDSGFLDFFSDYIKRIMYLRNKDLLDQARYLSKNNANIARIPVLREMFPKASIIVPVRDPFEHAASLFRQHQIFQEKHKHDPFSKKYMADIGHFEFGELHKRIDFPDAADLLAGLQPEQMDYWLAYWLISYQYLDTCEGIVLLDYRELCQNSYDYVVRLCEKIDVKTSPEQVEAASALLKAPKPNKPNKRENGFSPQLSETATKLYQDILLKAF